MNPGRTVILHFDFAFSLYSGLEPSNISASYNSFNNTSDRDTEIYGDQKMLQTVLNRPTLSLTLFSLALKFHQL